MVTRFERIEAFWERWYPALFGSASACLMAIEGPHWFHMMEKAQWKWDTLYGTSFNIAAVTTPFIFTFYTIFVTTDNGFIGRMKRTKAYNHTVNYTSTALWWSATLIVASLPLTLIVPKPSGHYDFWTYYVALWAGILVFSAASFFRAVRVFQVFISIQRSFKPKTA